MNQFRSLSLKYGGFEFISQYQNCKYSASLDVTLLVVGILVKDEVDAWGRPLVKRDIYFTFEFRNYLDLFSPPIGLKLVQTKYVTPAINSKRIWKLVVVAHVMQNTENSVISRWFLQKTAEKYTRIYNARTQPFPCSLAYLFAAFLSTFLSFLAFFASFLSIDSLQNIKEQQVSCHSFSCHGPNAFF